MNKKEQEINNKVKARFDKHGVANDLQFIFLDYA